MYKKLLLVPIISIIGFITLFSLVSAQVPDTSDKKFPLPEPFSDKERQVMLEEYKAKGGDMNAKWGEFTGGGGVSCFDYYRFQSVQVSVGTNKDSYIPGENVIFSGELINENNYPVVDGYVFVRIARENPNFMTDGNYVTDEFFGVEKVAIDTASQKKVQFKWNVPENITAGDYKADYFFSVGKKFNLGGLPFSNEVVIGSANFKVNSNVLSGVSFDRQSTKVNGVKYHHIGNWPIVDSGSKTSITQSITNTSNNTRFVDVTYDLYWWDGLNKKDKIATKSESISIPAGASKALSYSIPEVKEPVYYLKITALSEGQKSIINIRVASNLERPRLNYPAITKFPIDKGDDYTLFSCFHNSSGVDTKGRVVTTLYDKRGNEVDKFEYKGVITSFMMADKKDIKAVSGYDYLNLKAELFDKNGNLVDNYESVYDCNDINPDKCKKINANPIYILLAIIFIAIAVFIYYKKTTYKHISAIFIFFLFVTAIFGLSIDTADAYNQKSVTSSSNYVHGVRDGGDLRIAPYGAVSIQHIVNMISGNYDNTKIGDSINFSYSNSKTYTATGGGWDTPYFGQWQNIADGAGKLTWTANDPKVFMSSSNPSVVSCSGMSCKVVGSGSATLTANIGVTDARITSWIIWTGSWCQTDTSCKRMAPYMSSHFNWSSYTGSVPPGIQLNGGSKAYPNEGGGNTLAIPGTSVMSWDITSGPTVDLKVNNSDGPVTVYKGSTPTLKWSSKRAKSCKATGEWTGAKNTAGSETGSKLTTTGVKTFSLVCYEGAGNTGASVTDSVTVKVIVPKVYLYIDRPVGTSSYTTTVGYGGVARLGWSSRNAKSCKATDKWTGAKNTAGSEATSKLTKVGPNIFSLVCYENADYTGVSGTGRVTVNVAQMQCKDGIDNDGDGYVDTRDRGCGGGGGGNSPAPCTITSKESCKPYKPTPPPQCSDGIDNDKDGLIDGFDPDCLDPNKNTEVAVPDFSLLKSSDINITIVGKKTEGSGITTITVDSKANPRATPFSGLVNLSSNIADVVSGATVKFGDSKLSKDEYGRGSTFEVTVPRSAKGTHTITITGVSGNIRRAINVILNANVIEPNFKNF